MKKKSLRCFIALGLLLFFTLLLPFSSINVATVKAASVDKETINYRLNLKSITLVKGKTKTLKVLNLSENAKVSYKSNDSEIASVSEDGAVTANKVGNTVITATIKDGSSLTCDITVGPPAVSIKFTKSRIVLGKDNADYLRVILKPSNTAEDAGFFSSDKSASIISVSPGGRISAKELGMAYAFAIIEATGIDGSPKFAMCSVIVTSSDDAPYLDAYFNSHPELDSISDTELNKALENFFNGKIESSAYDAVKVDDVSKSTMVNNLNRYLESLFKLSEKRAAIEAASKLSSNQVEVISDNSAK